MATIRFTEDDRDSRGFIRLSPPVAEVATDAPELPPITTPAQSPKQARPPLSPRLRYQLTIAGAVVAGLLLVLLSMRLSAAPRAIRGATPVATAASTSMPAATAPTTAPIAMIDAYAAPNGARLDAIESARAITPTAHYGDGWIQADVAGSGLVWLRAADVPELAITGPDLAPRPTARSAAVPQRPAEPTDPPPPPTQCAEAGLPGKVVSSCGYEDLSVLQEQAKAKWIEQYGGNAGVVLTPSPQQWSRP